MRPPAAVTRRSSRSVTTGSLAIISARRLTAALNRPSENGSTWSESASISVTWAPIGCADSRARPCARRSRLVSMPTTSAAPASTSASVSRALPQPASSTEPAAATTATICGTPNGGTGSKVRTPVLAALPVFAGLSLPAASPERSPRGGRCRVILVECLAERVHEGHRVYVEELRTRAVGDGGGRRKALDEWAGHSRVHRGDESDPVRGQPRRDERHGHPGSPPHVERVRHPIEHLAIGEDVGTCDLDLAAR